MKNRKIRVVVLGDEKVGKTSLITTLYSETFPSKIEKVIGAVLLPPEMCAHAFDVSTILIDTSSEPKQESQVNEEIKEADAILLLYDISRGETVSRMQSFWLPRIKRISERVPIILVANKMDLQEDQLKSSTVEINKIHKVIKPLVKEFKQVEMGLECSALQCSNISEVIYCAQRAVLFPLAPIYNFNQKSLTPEFQRALTRIFRICDKDCDNILKDVELTEFQLEVFKGDLTTNDIKGIKEVIRDELNNPSNDNGLTIEGFIILQKRCIELMKIQICWTILRHFGYDDRLSLNNTYFKDELILQEDGAALELSGKPIHFLRNLFKRYSDEDGLVSLDEMDDIFYPNINAPSVPWTNIENRVPVKRNREGKICLTLESWVCLWSKLTFNDYKNAYKNLVYVGYEGSLQESFIVQENNTKTYSSLMKISKRHIFSIAVLGGPESGKSKFLDQFIEKEYTESYNPTVSQRSVVNQVKFITGKRKIIMMTEIPRIDLESLSNNKRQLKGFDFFVFVTDTDDKLQEFQRTFEKIIPQSIPKILVYSKTDLLQDSENLQESLQTKANALGFKECCTISSKKRDISKMVRSVGVLIEKPSNGLTGEIIEHLKRSDGFFRRYSDKLALGFMLFGTISLLIFYVGYRKRIAIGYAKPIKRR